jgi:hypothetical protein
MAWAKVPMAAFTTTSTASVGAGHKLIRDKLTQGALGGVEALLMFKGV